MSEKIVIKDFHGRILGTIEEDSYTGNKTARDFHGKILGTYLKRENQTRDFYGHIIAYGDVLSGLITDSDKNK